jgi:acyl-CoA synthetase (NDP forming)
VIFIPPLVTPSADVARVISEVIADRPEPSRPIVAVFLDPQADLAAIQAGERIIPVYDFPESAIAALGAAARYGAWRATPPGDPVPMTIDRSAVEQVLVDNAAIGEGWLTQEAVAKLLGAVGIQLPPARLVRSAEEAVSAALAIGRQVAIKVVEPTILHKSDVGGVILNVPPREAGEAYLRLESQLSSNNIALAAASVAPMAMAGVEVLVGVTHDPIFGPLLACGSGGVMVELLNDVVFRTLPLTDRDVTTMIAETRVHRLLRGFRGAPAADIVALEKLLLALGALAEAVPSIAEIDLNPVLVHPAGVGLTLIDARVRLAQ